MVEVAVVVDPRLHVVREVRLQPLRMEGDGVDALSEFGTLVQGAPRAVGNREVGFGGAVVRHCHAGPVQVLAA